MIGMLARFLPGIGPALTALLNPWILLGMLAAASGCFLSGMHLQSKLHDAALARGLQQQINQIADYQAEQRRFNGALARKLDYEQGRRRDAERKLADALRATPPGSLVTVECPGIAGPSEGQGGAPVGRQNGPAGAAERAQAGGQAGGSVADPIVRMSALGVRLWNERLSLGVAEAERGRFIDAAYPGAGPVAIADAIQNVADNAALLGQCREREAAWHRKACKEGWWEGPECQR